MNRRNFTLSLAAFGVASSFRFLNANQIGNNDLIKPNMLKEGDKVALIAPATNAPDPDDIQKAIEVIKFYNLQTTLPENLTNGAGYKTRSVQVRLDEIHKAFADSSIKAVFCIRGGYGSGQLLDKIDYKLIKNNPKIFLGYSDITAMHLAIHQQTGLITFHGPIMLSAFTNYTELNFRKVIFNNTPIGRLTNPVSNAGIRNANPIRTIVSGEAEGQLTGGNLSLVTSLLGTEYDINTKNKILFLEDVGEEPFRVDRMMNQLRLAGKFDDCNGIIFGKCNDCVYRGSPSSTWDSSLGEVLDLYLKDLKKPVFYGLMIGHTPDQLTLPIGLNVSFSADEGYIDIKESAVI